jgi:hypothetical protein
VPRRSPRSRKNVESSGPSGLGSPSEYSPVAPVGRTDLLSWDSRAVEPDCSGYRSHPSTDMPPSVHSRTHLSARASVPREPPSKSRSVLVVSHHLDGFLRSEVAGLLHPAASRGVHRVSWLSRVPSRPLDESRCRRECRCPPRDDFHTPRRIPLDDSRTTSPWPLPPCRSPRFRSTPPTASVARVGCQCLIEPERRLRGLAPPSSP